MRVSASVQYIPLNDGFDAIEVSAKFANLQPNGLYTFSLIDDNAPRCQGTKLMDIGRVFAGRNRSGFIQRDIKGISLNGSNSALGDYLLLASRIGEVACCRIEAGRPLKLPAPLPEDFDSDFDRIITSTPSEPIIRLDEKPEQTVDN